MRRAAAAERMKAQLQPVNGLTVLARVRIKRLPQVADGCVRRADDNSRRKYAERVDKNDLLIAAFETHCNLPNYRCDTFCS